MKCANCDGSLSDEVYWHYSKPHIRLIKGEETPFCHEHCYREYIARMKRTDRLTARIYGILIALLYLGVIVIAAF